MDFSEEIPDGLSKAGKELPFRVPARYFDDFPSRMQSLVDQELQPSASKRLTLMHYLRPVVGLAAAFAAVFILVYWPARLITHTSVVTGNNKKGEEERIINLVEPVDDHTFFSLLQNNSNDEKVDSTDVASYIASNYSDLDIYLETQK